MPEIKDKIEAVLFMTGRLMEIEELGEYAGIGSKGAVKEALNELIKDYNTREGGLEINEYEGKYKLNIKKKYNYLSTKLVSSSELEGPIQATLALIAYKQPARQSEIIEMRGNAAYDHIKDLKEQHFLTSEKCGRTRILKLTSKFFDYFDIIEQEAMKRQFKSIADKEESKLKDRIELDSTESAVAEIRKKIAEDELTDDEDKNSMLEEIPEETKISSNNFNPNDFGS